jgi:hypothetical protein
MSDVVAALNVPSLGNQHITDNAFAQHLYPVGNDLHAATLRAMLNDSLVTSRRLYQQPSLAQVMRTRLFNIDMLARVAGHDGSRRVPMVRSGNHNSVDSRVIENLAQIGGLLRRTVPRRGH